MLEDEAIRLRPLTPDDVDEWLAGQDDEQVRWFEFPRPAARDDVVGAVARWQESWRSGGPVRHWAVCVRDTGRIAGGVEVRDLGGGEVNLSYLVFPEHRRRGIATGASRLALDHAARELGATAAVIKVLEGNVASLAVARGLGAVECGTSPSEAGGTFVVWRLELSARSW